MNTRHTRSTFALAALLTGALALPGLAAADGNRGWGGGQGGEARGERHYDRDGGGRRSEWRGERRYGGGDRGWGGSRHHDHDHDRGHRYGYRDERPVYRPHRPHWLPGISVFLNGSW